MFTGIVETLGTVEAIVKKETGAALAVAAGEIAQDAKVGDSICINGACLTVIKIDADRLYFDVSGETLERTNISLLKIKDKVNIERALKLNTRLGGHLLTGHIDTKANITKKIPSGQYIKMEFKIKEELSKYIVEKGSVAVDGVSLTVAESKGPYFNVHIIPHTASQTTLGFKKENDIVSIEFDILGKYVEKLLHSQGSQKIDKRLLSEYGFI